MTGQDAEVRPRFYYLPEVAAELRCSEATVRWYIQVGRLKAGKIGRRLIFNPEDVDALIESGFKKAS